jgi:hypothetical protein
MDAWESRRATRLCVLFRKCSRPGSASPLPAACWVDYKTCAPQAGRWLKTTYTTGVAGACVGLRARWRGDRILAHSLG